MVGSSGPYVDAKKPGWSRPVDPELRAVALVLLTDRFESDIPSPVVNTDR